MRHLQYLTLIALFSISSFTHAACNNYGAGGIVCTGPDGYSATAHNYGAGGTTYQDNRGNTGSIHRYEGGATVDVPQAQYVPTPRYEAPGSMAQPGTSRGHIQMYPGN